VAQYKPGGAETMAKIVDKIVKLLKWAGVVLALAVLTLLSLRIYDVQRGPPLARWHTFVPHELRAKEIDAADWRRYLAEEDRVFQAVRAEVSQKLDADERIPINRYFEGSPVYPAHFTQDFNRSYVLEPDGAPVGAAVLLHGLTDSPYSQRHIARAYRDHGFVAIVIRMPGHGTVPAGLTDAEWEDWAAATRLAVREARRRTAASAPLHIVGFSNGGALALQYALDAIADPQKPRADRLVLISPMIGITRFARFAGIAGLPALLPAFAKAAWLSNVPEFNPFKYNSFPINGARQSYRLTRVLQAQIASSARAGRLAQLPPIITFQSVMDYTVSTSAIVSGLYDHLPANGSELVLFDVNRTVKFGPLLRRSADTALLRLLPTRPRAYRTTIITNADDHTSEAIARVTEAGERTEHTGPLGLTYPEGLYSLSHVALPFPMTDSLYGLKPDPADEFGINLGALAPRGERNVLIASLDALLRVASNPFFPYMLGRIEEGMDGRKASVASGPSAPVPAPPPSDEQPDWSFWDDVGLILQLGPDRSDPEAAPP
jgi:alpha-beta hydrolase superfamily lysophospholipase